MARVSSIWFGALLSVALMVAALAAWRFAPELAVRGAVRPYVAKVGIRSLAVALAAGAQLVLLAVVVARVYPPKLTERALGVGMAVASFAALCAAVVLALMSR